jgi:hypothetical protein
VGSGLILLVIVGAWLVVLVPMALRNSDVTGSLGSVDKFHDAMRVLSRRSSTSRADQDDAADAGEPAPGRLARSRAAAGAVRSRLSARRSRPPLSAAARRRRVLLVLLVLSLATLAGGLLGPIGLLAPHLLVDLLLVAFLVHLRRSAAARAERQWRSAMARPVRRPGATGAPAVVVRRAAAPARRLPVHVAGIPNRMPARPEPLAVPLPGSLPGPLPGPAAPDAQPPAARGAQGEAWSPVPVPAPTYLSAPAAPRRVVDLTRPGAYSDGLADAERDLGIVDEGPALEEILERRRAVNDW